LASQSKKESKAKKKALAPAIEQRDNNSKAKKKSKKKKKEIAGLAVGNKKDPGMNPSRPNAEVEADEADPNIDIFASQSKSISKTKKKAPLLALAPAIEPHDPGTREVRSPDGQARAKRTAETRRRSHAKNRRER
jgi:hypothetical protein